MSLLDKAMNLAFYELMGDADMPCLRHSWFKAACCYRHAAPNGARPCKNN